MRKPVTLRVVPVLNVIVKLGIQSRLFIAFIGTIGLVVVAMVLAVNWRFEHGLVDYLRQVELERLDKLVSTLSRAYGKHGDWAFLRHNRRGWGEIMDLGLGRPRDAPPGEPGAHLFSPEQRPFPPHRPPPWNGPPPEGRPHGPPVSGVYSFRPGPLDEHPARRGFGDAAAIPPNGPPAGEISKEVAGESAPIAPPRPPPDFREAPPPPPPPAPLDLRRRLRLFDADGVPVFGRPGSEEEDTRRPIQWQGETVGFLALRPGDFLTDELALAFQAGQRRTYVLIAVLALLLSALASLLLARRLLRPIRRITAGAKALGAGRYATRIQADRSDELGHLAQDFNHLAAALERNEKTRRQWVADISHELRTPLSILRGEIEAILDGVRQVSAERLQSLHGEVLGLGKLVDDLYELALSDLGALDYKRETLDLAELVEEAMDGFRRRFAAKGLQLVNHVHGPLPLTGDSSRLQQLFTNLLENSQRYTDSGGRLEISLEAADGWYHLLLQDTAPAVPERSLPQLFERLYRVDKSRSRGLGGAGLGLAICRNIVAAHGGHIDAAHSSLGGLALHIRLPADSRRVQ